MDQKNDAKDMMKVMQLRPEKMKDKPVTRSRIVIDCQAQFGFLPNLIFIDKVYGKHDTIIISAVTPKEMTDDTPKKRGKVKKDE